METQPSIKPNSCAKRQRADSLRRSNSSVSVSIGLMGLDRSSLCDFDFSLRFDGDSASVTNTPPCSGECPTTVARRGRCGLCVNPKAWLGSSDGIVGSVCAGDGVVSGDRDEEAVNKLSSVTTLWSVSWWKIWLAAKILRGRREERADRLREVARVTGGAMGRGGS